MPVIRVSWNDAQEYLAWLSQLTGFNYRLPNEAEWEYAARAGTETSRYWGDEIGKGLAACKGCGSEWERTGTAPVGSFAPNPFGLFDMLGNVYEWVADCWNDRHEGGPGIATARQGGDCARRVSKSGSFGTDQKVVVSAFRKYEFQDSRLISLGFRVARDDG